MSASTGSVAGPARLWPQRLRFLPPALNDYLNATSSLTSPKANTQTETMLPRSQPPKALLDLPSSPAKRRGVEGPGSATGHRPLPAPPLRRGISAPPPIRPLFVPNKKRIRPEPGPPQKSKAHPAKPGSFNCRKCHSDQPPPLSFRTQRSGVRNLKPMSASTGSVAGPARRPCPNALDSSLRSE